MKGLEQVLLRALTEREFLDRLKQEDYDPGQEYRLTDEEKEILKTLRFVHGGEGIESMAQASSEAMARLMPQVHSSLSGSQSRDFARVEPKLERVASKLERVEPKLQRVAPKLERTAPKLDRVAPKLERVEPKLERVSPKLERVQPKLERVAPKLERVQPKLERVVSKLERGRSQ
jgi:exonuclease VII small subunit